MTGLTTARSNRRGLRGTRMTVQRYDFNVRDGKGFGNFLFYCNKKNLILVTFACSMDNTLGFTKRNS